MSQLSDADRLGLDVAVVGLRGAFQRCMDAYEKMDPDDDLMFIACGGVARASIVEFLVWACTRDEWLRGSDPTYAGRRDTDEQGRVLIALRFVRDRHLHQMATTMIPGEEISPRRPGDPLQARLAPGTSSLGEHGSIGASWKTLPSPPMAMRRPAGTSTAGRPTRTSWRVRRRY